MRAVFRAFTDAGAKPLPRAIQATAATSVKPKPTEEPGMKISETLTVPSEKLRHLFDLPSWADEATISAAMKCAPAPDVIRACSQRTSTVTALAASRTPRAALPQQVDQASHDQFMAQHFATDRRRLQGDVSVHDVHG